VTGPQVRACSRTTDDYAAAAAIESDLRRMLPLKTRAERDPDDTAPSDAARAAGSPTKPSSTCWSDPASGSLRSRRREGGHPRRTRCALRRGRVDGQLATRSPRRRTRCCASSTGFDRAVRRL